MPGKSKKTEREIGRDTGPYSFRKALLAWYDRNARDLPWRWATTGELSTLPFPAFYHPIVKMIREESRQQSQQDSKF